MSGRPKKVEDVEILRQIKLTPGPVATSPEMTKELDMSSTGVNSRLRELVDDGLVKKQNVGANAVVYWLSDDGEEYLAKNGD